jgi:hypothetical protein
MSTLAGAVPPAVEARGVSGRRLSLAWPSRRGERILVEEQDPRLKLGATRDAPPCVAQHVGQHGRPGDDLRLP